MEKTINGKHFSVGRWPLSMELPTIIFIHGAGGSKAFWKYQIDELSEKFNTIAIDLPGHGGSKESPCRQIGDYADFVDELILDLELKSVFLCGHSMGGATTLKLLLDGKNKYKAAVISNSGAKLGVHDMIFDMIRDDFKKFAQTFDFAALAKNSDKERLSFLGDDIEKNGQDAALSDFEACNSFDERKRLNEIDVPVLVVTGEEDKLVPKKFGKLVADSINNCFYENDINSGHMTPAESPNYFNGVLLRFIEEKNIF